VAFFEALRVLIRRRYFSRWDDFLEMALYLAIGHSAAVHRDDLLVEQRNAPISQQGKFVKTPGETLRIFTLKRLSSNSKDGVGQAAFGGFVQPLFALATGERR